jgi:hypothetical protein
MSCRDGTVNYHHFFESLALQGKRKARWWLMCFLWFVLITERQWCTFICLKKEPVKKNKISEIKHRNVTMKLLIQLSFFFLFFSFIIVLGGSTLWHLHRFLQCIKYIIHEFPYYSPVFLNKQRYLFSSKNRG